MFTKLRRQNNEFFIPEKKNFFPDIINKDFISEISNFCFDMTFGKKGEHRKYRSGGTHFRRNGEIFCDTFQGKLGEYFVYQKLNELGINCSKPDIERWGLGKWDDYDLVISEKSINVKSMAHFSNLLLLETKDWNKDGIYIPNGKPYDYFIVSRTKPDLKSIFKLKRMLYSDNIPFSTVKTIIDEINFEADIPGYIDNLMLVNAIATKQILPKGALLNGRIRMDAENYYILSNDFLELEDMVQTLSTLTKPSSIDKQLKKVKNFTEPSLNDVINVSSNSNMKGLMSKMISCVINYPSIVNDPESSGVIEERVKKIPRSDVLMELIHSAQIEPDITKEALIKPYKNKNNIFLRLKKLSVMEPFLSENEAKIEFMSALTAAENHQQRKTTKASILSAKTKAQEKEIVDDISRRKLSSYYKKS